MEARPLYKRVWDIFGSRDLSVFIFVMGMTYFLILLIFATVIPIDRVNKIGTLLPYKVLYLLFFINLVVCEIKWIPVIIRKCRKPRPPETNKEMERFGQKAGVRCQVSGVSGIEKYLKRRGYRIQSAVSSQESHPSFFISHPSSLILYAYRGRFSPIGNVLFHASFLFFLIGTGLSLFYRFEGTMLLAERQGVAGEAKEFSAANAAPFASLPRLVFEVDKVAPTFWKNMLLFTDLKADISYNNGEKGTTRLSKPLVMDGARITIAGIGITTAYTLREGSGNLLDEGYVNLNIFVPGSEDAFRIPEMPYEIYVSFYPDYEIRNGRAASRSMNPVNPAFGIRILDMRKKRVYSGILRPGEDALFDGYRLSFGDISYAGVFKVVKDRGFVFIWTGIVLMISGLVWRLLLYRREIVIRRLDDGTMNIAGYSEYCRELFAKELELIVGMK